MDLEKFFQNQNKKKQVKILTCGSVDDGKSTLLGRLLYDSQNVFIDQMDQAKIENKLIRFRTLGCYPLTGAIESSADSVENIIIELLESKNSEREGRAIDKDQIGSMEKKKQEGYF